MLMKLLDLHVDRLFERFFADGWVVVWPFDDL